MKSISRYLFLTFAMLLSFVVPAFATTVASPLNGAQVSNPFPLVASAPTCKNLATTAFGYSIDYGATTMVSNPYTGLVLTSVGSHTLHLKAWNKAGSVCVTNLAFTANDTLPPTIPSGITAVGNVEALSTWSGKHDPGTPGTASGTSAVTSSPSLSGQARVFSMSYTKYGGEIFHTSLGKDVDATHFIYDVRVYLASPVNLGNLELDMNQVVANGDTVIYGFQCDGYSKTWDYTVNTGTETAPRAHWVHSTATCDGPSNWTPDTWHHVQVAYSRDANGNATYQTVVFDGVAQDMNATGYDSFALGWGAVLLTNFQMDGLGAGASNTAYADNLTVYRW